jgi:hypothetical protein
LNYAQHDRNSGFNAGLSIGGRGGVSAFYNRYDHDRRGHNRRFGIGHRRQVYRHAEFYGGRCYPYGYNSPFDYYYHRYPYRYSYAVAPVWSVYVGTPYRETVYVDDGPDVVYVEGDDYIEGDDYVETQPAVSQEPVVIFPDDFRSQQQYEGAIDTGTIPNRGSAPQFQTAPPIQTAPLDVDGDTLPDDGNRIDVQPQERIPVINEFLAQAHQAFQGRDYATARTLFAKAVLNEPDNGLAELSYAVGLFATGEYAQSAGALRRGLALAPDVVDMPLDVTRIYGDAGDLKSHVQRLQFHVASSPEDADAWLVLGHIHFSIGEPVEAARAFDRAKALHPRDPYADILSATARRIAFPQAGDEATP